jgi:disulfide bond formation protein DsbB
MDLSRFPPAACAGFAAAGAALVLGAALAFQHIGGLAPCVLCYLQRYPYWAAIPLAAAAALTAPRAPRMAAVLLGLAAAAFLTDAGIAAFHVGVEQKWWQGTAECGGTQSAAASIDELRARLLAAPIVRCDEAAWRLFGISMAGYNFLAALALALVSGHATRRLWKGEA